MTDVKTGEALFAEGKIEEAEKCFLDLLKNDPKNPETLNNLGVIQHAKGNLQEAEDLFIKALAAKEDYLEALLNLVDLYQNAKRWKEASVHLEKCLEIEDKDPNLLNQLGMVYLEMGDTEKAQVALKESLELNPDQDIVRESLTYLESQRIQIKSLLIDEEFLQEKSTQIREPSGVQKVDEDKEVLTHRKNIKFNLATREQATEMVDFHNRYYKTNRKPDHWLWEHKTFMPGKAIFAFATDNNNLVATQAMLPIYMNVRNKKVLSGKSESTLALPSYRGTSLMKDLYEYAVQNCISRGMEFLWGFTPAVKAFKKFGFDFYSDILMMIRPGSSQRNLCHYVPQLGNQEDYQVRIQPCEKALLEDFYKNMRAFNKDAIFINCNKAYLDWRVRFHPFLKYREYQVFKENELRGYALVAIAGDTISISDLTSLDTQATAFLLNTILQEHGNNAKQFHYLGNARDRLGQDVIIRLLQSGFALASNWNLVLRDLSGNDKLAIFDESNWHINGLWTEGYSM